MDNKTILKTRKYTIDVTDYTDGTSSMERVNEGFNGLELIGILEFARSEIIQQLKGQFKPDIITRTVIQEKTVSEIPFKDLKDSDGNIIE